MFFFPIVIAVYFVIPKKLRGWWLLVASYYFYMSWNASYALLIGASTIITYASGIIIHHFSEEDVNNNHNKKRIVVIVCILINLAILAIFKYGNFVIESVNSILNLLHIRVIQKKFDLLLPVGISFYTFQALGYIIDVYRGDVEVETNFPRYALFVSFFSATGSWPNRKI